MVKDYQLFAYVYRTQEQMYNRRKRNRRIYSWWEENAYSCVVTIPASSLGAAIKKFQNGNVFEDFADEHCDYGVYTFALDQNGNIQNTEKVEIPF